MDRLRERAQDLVRAEEWQQLLDLAPRLRADTDRWVDLWAPTLAIAARQLADPGARALLDEAVGQGFWQPELFAGKLEALFGGDPDWTDVAAAMAANIPRPRQELTAWPELPVARPVAFTRIAPERVPLLRDRLPAPQASAWATATELTRWVSNRWEHSGEFHVEWKDAVHVLDRVEAGERFACVEYTILLSQALNAVGIPARTVRLLLRNHHVGIGRAHQVTEAWIDDLGRWVLLDGQNGMYWTASDGSPLHAVELRHRLRAGEPPAGVESLAGKRSAGLVDMWWGYFHTLMPEGYLIAPPPFAPVFQSSHVMATEQLLSSPDGLHPDLLEIGVAIANVDGAPAIRPVSRHPHARGFELSYDDTAPSRVDTGEAAPVPAGARSLTIATVTDFGVHAPRRLLFAS